MDSQGAKVKDLAEAFGVSRTTICNWRASPEYRNERARWTTEILAKIEPLVMRLKISALQAGELAVGTLLDALEATNDNGEPLWWARLRAAEAILRNPAVAAALGFEEGGTTIDLNTVVEVVIRHEGDARVIDVQSLEVIDAELVAGDAPFEEVLSLSEPTATDCQNGPDPETGEYPCDPDASGTCTACGRVARFPEEVSDERTPSVEGDPAQGGPAEEAEEAQAPEDHLGDGGGEAA